MDKKTENKFLLDSFLELKRATHQALYGKALPIKQVKEFKKQLDELLQDPTNYIDIEFKEDRLSRFVIVEKKHDPFDGHILRCHQLYIENITTKKVQSFTQKLFKFYGEETKDIRFYISSDPSKSLKILLKFGFVVEGQRIVGNIKKSLEVIESRGLELAEGFNLRAPQLKDIEKILQLEIDAHKNEPTSVLDYEKVDINEIKKFLFKLRKEETFGVVYHNNEPIAHMGYHFKEGRGCIGTIAVAVNYQRQGLSYILYEYALREMLKKKVKVFTGYTATFKVLKQGIKLGRKPYEYILRYQS